MTGGVLVLAVAAALLALWYRSYYNIWPGQDATARVHWCERDYQDGGPRQTWQEVTAGIGVLCQLECEGEFRAEVLRWIPGYLDDDPGAPEVGEVADVTAVPAP